MAGLTRKVVKGTSGSGGPHIVTERGVQEGMRQVTGVEHCKRENRAEATESIFKKLK